MGDFNVAPEDRDVWDPKKFVGATHVTEPERKAVARLEEWGLEDVFRRVYPDADGLYSYWDYRAGDFHQHRGMRIDLVLATAPVAERVTWAVVDRNARKGTGPSDHAPVIVDLARLTSPPPRQPGPSDAPPPRTRGRGARARGRRVSSAAKYASSLVPARKRANEPSITHASLNSPSTQ